MQFIQKGLIIALILYSFALQAQFSVSIQVDQNISCYGGNNGGLTAIVSPVGTAYTFSWSNGGNSASISDLVADTYIVTVQNAAGGTVIATAILSEPQELVLTSLTELPLVVNPTGTVEVETTGGTAPYAFEWTDEANNPFSNEEDLMNAPAGIYTQTATDANGCTAELSPVELVATSGADDLEGHTVRAFPNPASKDLVIEIPEGENVLVQVFNSMGQIIESKMLQGPQESISVANWPSGYFHLIFPDLSKNIKVLVDH